MAYYVSDSFDLSMVTDYDLPCVSVMRVEESYAQTMLVSEHSHAYVTNKDLVRRLCVTPRKPRFTLKRGDDLLVAQPCGEAFRWMLVSIEEYDLQAALSWFRGKWKRLSRVWSETNGDTSCFINALHDYDPYAIGVTLGIIANTPMGIHSAHAYDAILGRLRAAWDGAADCSGSELDEFRLCVRAGFLAACDEIDVEDNPIEVLNDCLTHAGVDYEYANH